MRKATVAFAPYCAIHSPARLRISVRTFAGKVQRFMLGSGVDRWKKKKKKKSSGAPIVQHVEKLD